jgi:hypothetical protein
VLLAILEKTGVLSPLYAEDGQEMVGVGTVAAGYQNFLICIEMLFAAIALRFAFTHSIYAQEQPVTTQGRTVSLQSISSNLKETMNPRDIMTDAVHNFHPHYQQYTQQGSKIPPEEMDFYGDREIQPPGPPPAAIQPPPSGSRGPSPSNLQHHNGHVPPGQQPTDGSGHPQQRPPTGRGRYSEKTALISSDDEFP